MKLIDADARVTVLSFDRMNDEYSHDEMSISEALDFATDEGCPPTIDAIPVEWLRKYDDAFDNVLPISSALRAWEEGRLNNG